MDEINAVFGELLASHRKAAGLTQQELANAVGISRSAVASIESGKQGVLLTSIFQFAAVLSISPRELIPLVTLESKINSVITNDINRDLLLSLVSETKVERK